MSLPPEISFIVSRNDKGGNDKRPDYRGEVKIGAATYDLAAWMRTKAGTDRKFVSGKLTMRVPKGEEAGSGFDSPSNQPSKPPSNPQPAQNLDEDVPF